MTYEASEKLTAGAHTPGPWLRIDTADYAEIHAAFRPSSQAVALVAIPSDADLIAAAPDLIEALEDLLGATEEIGYVHYAPFRAAARKAIAKARGAA